MGKDAVYSYYIWLMDQKGRIRYVGGPTTEERGKRIAAKISLLPGTLNAHPSKLAGWEYTYERQALAVERKQGKGQQP